MKSDCTPSPAASLDALVDLASRAASMPEEAFDAWAEQRDTTALLDLARLALSARARSMIHLNCTIRAQFDGDTEVSIDYPDGVTINLKEALWDAFPSAACARRLAETLGFPAEVGRVLNAVSASGEPHPLQSAAHDLESALQHYFAISTSIELIARPVNRRLQRALPDPEMSAP